MLLSNLNPYDKKQAGAEKMMIYTAANVSSLSISHLKLVNLANTKPKFSRRYWALKVRWLGPNL